MPFFPLGLTSGHYGCKKCCFDAECVGFGGMIVHIGGNNPFGSRLFILAAL